jgi:Haemolymph juvenile hormone binding protein (JHBP)
MDSVEKIRPNLNSGDFGGGFEVPALEPMFIDKIAMNRGADFQAIFSNLTVSGPGRFIVQNLKLVRGEQSRRCLTLCFSIF